MIVLTWNSIESAFKWARQGSWLHNMETTGTQMESPTWKRLFRIGGIAPLITLAMYLGQWLVILLTGEAYPITSEEWFTFFQRGILLGLICWVLVGRKLLQLGTAKVKE